MRPMNARYAAGLVMCTACAVAVSSATSVRQSQGAAGPTALESVRRAAQQYQARRFSDAESSVVEAVRTMRQERAAQSSNAAETSPRGTGIYLVGGVVPEPTRTRDAVPQISEDAARAGASGIVVLEFVVSKVGRVEQIEVLKSVPGLDDAARAAARDWRYAPTVVNGQAADVLVVSAINLTWRTDPMPAAYLDMGRVYLERRHYAHAEELLSRALTAIRAEAAAFGGAPGDQPRRVTAPAGSTTSGAIAEPKRVKYVDPVYPVLAQKLKISGYVIIDAVIDPTGRVKGVRVLKSTAPPLDQAAVDAVRQWEYAPAQLAGVPIEVLMSVTVIFSLR